MIRYLLGAVLSIIGAYGALEAWPLIAGPKIAVDTPQEHATFFDPTVTVSGQVTRAAELTINGALALHDQNGHFSSTLTFPRGGSILTFIVTDRFGRSVATTRTIFIP